MKKPTHRALELVQKHPSIEFIIVFLIAFIFFASVQFSFHNLADYDSYYHLKMAEEIRQNGLVKDMKWMKYTVLADNFYDYHLLGHIVLIPFTFGDRIFWGKIAAVLLSSLVILTFYWFLHKNKIKYKALWTLLLICSSYLFMRRLLYVRVSIQLSIILSILALHYILNYRKKALLVITYIYTLTYAAFFIPFLFALLDTIIRWIRKRKLNYELPLFSLIGIILGIFINPYFPNNIKIWYMQIIKISLFRNPAIYNPEWQQLSIKYFVLFTGAIIIAMIFAIFFILRVRKKIEFDRKIILTLTITAMFSILYIKSLRLIEYFIPFSILFIAYLVDHNISEKQRGERKTKIILHILIGIVIACGVGNFLLLNHEVGYFDTINNYQGCAEWLKNNTAKDSHVFIQYWDQMPTLFFYNDNNVYTLGLEEHFMYFYNETLYTRYKQATKGKDNPYDIIKNDFNSSYIFIYTGKDAFPFYLSFKNDTRIKAVYSDKACAVFEVK